MTSKALAFPLLVFCVSVSWQLAGAATVTAASCSSSAVQTAVNSANTGDTVLVPGGSCTYTTTVTVPNTKAITINGGGNTTITTSAHNAFDITPTASAATRFTGFTIVTSGVVNDSQSPIKTHGSTTTFAFRVDHNTFSAGDASTFISADGNAPGLIDHNGFTAGASAEMVHNLGAGPSSNAGWQDSVTPGSANMLFLEDNTFTYNATGNPAYYWGTAALQSYYGARTVFRHNTMNMVHVDQHGTAGMVGARWWEIYNNTFNTNVANASMDEYIHLRGGSGVVYGNTHSGANQAAGGIALEEEDTGSWPLAYQVGSGINGNTNGHAVCGSVNSSPAYFWGNSADMAVGVDEGGIQLNRDYFVSAQQPSTLSRQELSGDTCSTTYSYTAFTYPYPLDANGLPTGGGSQAQGPQPPSNLAAQVQ